MNRKTKKILIISFIIAATILTTYMIIFQRFSFGLDGGDFGCYKNNPKCYSISSCGGGGVGLGCAIGSTSYKYKDPNLTIFYNEINSDQAVACVVKYVKSNTQNNPVLKYIDLRSIKLIEGDGITQNINFTFSDPPVDLDKSDTYFWSIAADLVLPGKEGGYIRYFNVGAQSCKVYPDDLINTIP